MHVPEGSAWLLCFCMFYILCFRFCLIVKEAEIGAENGTEWNGMK